MPPWLRTELFSSTTFYPGKKKKMHKNQACKQTKNPQATEEKDSHSYGKTK